MWVFVCLLFQIVLLWPLGSAACAFLWNMYSGRTAELWECLCLDFVDSISFPKWLEQFNILSAVIVSSSCSVALSTFDFVFLQVEPSVKCASTSFYGLDFHSSNIWKSWAALYVYWSLGCFLFEQLIHFFCPNFYCFVAFFLVLCRSALKLQDINPLIYTLPLSFPAEGFVFRLFAMSFDELKYSILK